MATRSSDATNARAALQVTVLGNLDDIRSILLQRENDRIAALEARLDIHRQRAGELAEVLPAALVHAHEDGTLSQALAEPMTDAVTRTVREQPQRFAEALFPIMGPAIRRSIAEALKSFTQQINDAVEHSLTPRGIRWRIEARRAGVSFSEYVLRQTRTFDVEQLFVMETSSGRLLGHQSDNVASLKDKDAVSAMFSALQSFVRESFVGDNSDGLEIAEISGKTVWAVHGTRFSLAAVMAGLPPRALRGHLRDALDAVERLSDSDSDDQQTFVPDSAVVEQTLSASLRSMPVDSQPRSRGGWLSASTVLFALLFAGALWWGYRLWQQHTNEATVTAALADMPGLVINDVSFSGHRGSVAVLADPLAGDVQAALSASGLDPDNVTLTTTPYVSLHPELVTARLRAALAAPGSVTISKQLDRVVISGVADAQWIQSALLKISVMPGMAGVDFDVAASDPVATAPVITPEMRRLKNAIEQRRIRFADGVRVAADNESTLASLSEQLASLDQLCAQGGIRYGLTVLGATDDSGSDVINTPLRLARATVVQQQLIDASTAFTQLDDVDIAPNLSASERSGSVRIVWRLPGVPE
ncbi:MAG: hypothetical protein AAF004_14955 [Pseudomonadota bacterium]